MNMRKIPQYISSFVMLMITVELTSEEEHESVWNWKAGNKLDTYEEELEVEIFKSCVFCYERGLCQVVIQDQADTCVLCLFKSRLL